MKIHISTRQRSWIACENDINGVSLYVEPSTTTINEVITMFYFAKIVCQSFLFHESFVVFRAIFVIFELGTLLTELVIDR